MSTQQTQKPATWFWIVSALLLIWNLLGVTAYFYQVLLTAEDLKAMPEAEQSLYMDIPAWVTSAFAIAVFGGTIGCIGLLLRKRWSKPVLILSLIAIILQMFYNILSGKATEVYGPGGLIMPILTIAVGVFLVWLIHYAIRKFWII